MKVPPALIPSALKRPENLAGPDWTTYDEYYPEIGESKVNSTVFNASRFMLSTFTFINFGRPKVETTPGFDRIAKDSNNFEDGNIMVASVHRDELDTVLLPLALERAGIHHSRPLSKIELYRVHSLVSWWLHSAGAIALDRDNADMAGLGGAQKRITELKGNVTTYPEEHRIRQKTEKVLKVARGIILAAAETGSLIVPVGIAGLSTEADPIKLENGEDGWKKISRDSRSKFGLFGAPLVFAFGTPLEFDALLRPEALEGEKRPSKASREAYFDEINRRAEILRTAMQEAQDLAYEERGSSQEKKYHDRSKLIGLK